MEYNKFGEVIQTEEEKINDISTHEMAIFIESNEKRQQSLCAQDKEVLTCRTFQSSIRPNCRIEQSSYISIFTTGWTKRKKRDRGLKPQPQICRCHVVPSSEQLRIWRKPALYEKSRTTVKTAVQPSIVTICSEILYLHSQGSSLPKR